ncbi:arabinose isomerase [Spirosoma utsteinense]|uniref:L-arabinose isomerase n=1 Tax=Spirosoma utsteinense TaxID=2585773 RepID=A0ABR6WF30_9BACT|nr:arabinose isomerase [Spirosoma utsteinense]MBC3788687.1 L-arabinose isomerase [Spirosoma utsteinense]MBC3794621.1 L-arabinose isomerase [Spirosoma utsteinense]
MTTSQTAPFSLHMNGTPPATPALKVGLFGIGLDAYWPQFAGLEDRLLGYVQQVAEKLQRPYAQVVNIGLVDTPDKAVQAGHYFRQADVDILFVYVTTYALSATVLPVVQRANVPVILLNLAPDAAIDYDAFNQLNDRTRMTGEWLAYCSACPVPEIANVFRRAGISFHQVTGMLHNDPVGWREIDEWIEAAHVAQVMAHNRLGLMGNYYGGMLDIYSDPTLQLITFGGQMVVLEVDELSALKEDVSQEAIQERIDTFSDLFDVQTDCAPAELYRAARTSVALDQLVEKYQLGSLAYYHKGTGNPTNADTMSSIILGTSLLTGRGVPVAGEYEIKNAQAMKIMDTFGAGGSFTEYYALDFTDDVVLMGHDGPGHVQITEGKTKVKPLQVYHGKVGAGLSIEMSIKNGPVTLLSVVEDGRGKLQLLVAEGESVAGPILEIGNTNSRYRFPMGARQFVNDWNSHGPAHHCAVGVGHIASKLEKLGQLLRIEVIQVG